MKVNRGWWVLGAALALMIIGRAAVSADPPQGADEALTLSASQKEFLTFEPLLVTLRLESERLKGLPPAPAQGDGAFLRFEVTPPVKFRSTGKPLPLEAKVADLGAALRTYDLLEWFQFPAQGRWTVQAVVQSGGVTLKSEPVKVSVTRPAKDDKEHGPVDRLHHMPWSNYTTNAFCGDCFDLVKRWPDSKLARYPHYWNGVFHQNNKEYDKALESYRAASKYPGFVLAEHARFGVVECLLTQGKKAEAARENLALLSVLEKRCCEGTSAVLLLARRAADQAPGATAGAVRKE
ncbi:MAG: hypothetical protein L0Z62_03175 [Gemmataceae bacterium]|nr:hypothetical protein [Gemmataceae bacterium]